MRCDVIDIKSIYLYKITIITLDKCAIALTYCTNKAPDTFSNVGWDRRCYK